MIDLDAIDADPWQTWPVNKQDLRGLVDEIERLREALQGFLHWADSECPCHNDEPNPCPLCGASVENLEACKAIQGTAPRRLLDEARTALGESK
jgi:hypothetical protein